MVAPDTKSRRQQSQAQPQFIPPKPATTSLKKLAEKKASDTQPETGQAASPSPVTSSKQGAISIILSDSADSDGQAWLSAQSPDEYTAQLAASLDSDAIERFIKDQPTVPGLHYVHIVQRGRDWYISLYGAFGSVGEAKAAIAELPSSLRKNAPWIRQMATLQKLLPQDDVDTNTNTTDETETSPLTEEAPPTPQVKNDTDGGAALPAQTAALSVESEQNALVSPAESQIKTPAPTLSIDAIESSEDLAKPPVLE
jgi:hypothetical protein